jgi:ribose 5-phosphate isomerase A
VQQAHDAPLTPSEVDAAKALAARAAVAEIRDGMIVGLGTGSTAALAIAALAERIADGLRISAVATSRASDRQAAGLGIRVLDFADFAQVDLAIDGADEVDPSLRAIKGAGGALLREKIVARAARRMICIVDANKRVARLGAAPVPVEILPFAREFVSQQIGLLGGHPVLRAGVATDQGNAILDCRFEAIDDPETLDRALSAIPGLLGHGLFLSEIDALFVGGRETVEKVEKPVR